MKRFYPFLLVMMLVFVAITANAQDNQRADSALMRYLVGEGLIPYPTRDVQLFTNGHDKFRALFDDIDHAKRKVWLEYFILANDSIGKLTMQHLIDAAKRGCEVRVITDYYKDQERHYGMGRPEYADSLAQLGVDFVMFDRYKVLWFNHVCRDHRKIVNIDDSIGYIGGLNVADYYLVGKPAFGGWRDTHARITGAAVEGLAKYFHTQYQASGGKGRYTFNRYYYTDDFSRFEAGDRTSPTVVYFERVHNGGYQKQAETRNAIIAAFDAARDTIRFVTPYLLPTHTVRQAIIRALDRGVHVELLFSKVGDSPMLSYGNYHFAMRLIRHGAKVYLYKGKFHHSKIMMVDGQFSMVGSANLNSRSLKWDYEASSFIFSSEVTSELNRIFEADKLQCDILTRDYYKMNYSRSFRLKGALIDRFLTPVL